VKRLFLAVDLDAGSRDHARRVIDDLRARIERDPRMKKVKISWVPLENLHVTLHFLGSVTDEHAGATIDALQPALPLEAFTMTPGEVGAFPASGAPRVVWIGVREGADRLRALHGLVGDRLRRAGHAIEARPFRAHFTLARVRGRAPLLSRIVASCEHGPAPATLVDHVTLYESHSSAHGSRYDALVRTRLVEP
jgi:2'-5' RNA ligase